MIHVLVLAAVLGAHHGSATAAKPATTLEKARAKMRSLDFEAALPLLQRVLESEKLTGPQRAAVLIDLATTRLNLDETDEARESFARALDADPDVSLPKGTSPKIQDLFDEVRKRREAPPPPPPAAAPVEPEPAVREVKAVEPEPAPPVASKPTTPVSDVTEGAPASGQGRKIAAYTLIGLGVAVGGGAGGGCLGYSWKQKADWDAGKLSRDEASRANMISQVGVAMIAVGSAALVTGVVLALLPDHANETQVVLAPTPTGAAAFVSFRFP